MSVFVVVVVVVVVVLFFLLCYSGAPLGPEL